MFIWEKCLFSFVVSLHKCLAHFLFIRKTGEIFRVKQFSSQKNDVSSLINKGF